MYAGYKILKDLCDEHNILYKEHQKEVCLVEVKSKTGDAYYFVKGASPVNSLTHLLMCRDKDIFYELIKNVTNTPKTLKFYKSDDDYQDIEELCLQSFSYPFVVKMNSGERGRNVFKVSDYNELVAAMKSVYCCDNITIVQKYIDPKTEYRALVFEKELIFVYKKNNENGQYNGNLNPLYYEGSFIELVNDKDLQDRIYDFVIPVFDVIKIPYIAFDIILDKEDKLWLIEGNSAPGFEKLLKTGTAGEIIKNLYKKMFEKLKIL